MVSKKEEECNVQTSLYCSGQTKYMAVTMLCWWAYLNKRLGDENWTKNFLSPNKCNSNSNSKSHEDRNVRRTRWTDETRSDGAGGSLTITATAPISPVSEERSLPSLAPRAILQICWCLHCSLYAEEVNTTNTHPHLTRNQITFLFKMKQWIQYPGQTNPGGRVQPFCK